MTDLAGDPSAPAVAVGPGLVMHEPAGAVRALALVLPGGKVDSFDPTHPRQLTSVRMAPFVAALRHRGEPLGLAVWFVRYRYRGWNGPKASPVDDARSALEEARQRYGTVATVAVGHSMGGRAALRIAGEENVRGAVALAPWLPHGEPLAHLRDRRIVIAHGSLDLVTSPRASHRFAERARLAGAEVDYVPIRGDSHPMLLRARTWHRIATQAAVEVAGLVDRSAQH